MVAVADKILGRKLPVAGHQPFLHAAEHLGPALFAVPTVQQQVKIEPEAADVIQEGRSGFVPSGPDCALVVEHLRHFDKPPLGLVQFLAVGVLEEGHPNQFAVGGIAPPVIWAGKDGGVAFVVAAHLHAAVHTGVQEYVGHSLTVAAEDHRLFAHRRDEVVAGLGDLGLVANHQPSAGEHLLLLPLVDLSVYEDFTADQPSAYVNHGTAAAGIGGYNHKARPPGMILPILVWGLVAGRMLAALTPRPATPPRRFLPKRGLPWRNRPGPSPIPAPA